MSRRIIDDFVSDEEARKGPESRATYVSENADTASLEDILADVGRTAVGDRGAAERLAGERGASAGRALGGAARAAATTLSPIHHALAEAAPTGETAVERRARRSMSDAIGGSSEDSRGQFQGGNAGTIGAMQALSLEHYDEGVSALTGRPIEEVRAEMEDVEERVPLASGAGRVGGNLLLGALVPGPAGGGTGIGGAAMRVGAAATQGAGLGALAAHGLSEGDTPEERLAEMPEGALYGGAVGGTMQGIGEAGSAALSAARRAAPADAADRLRVASVATGTGRELNDSLMRAADAQPGGVSALAERLRRLELVGPTSTAQDVFERATRASDELGSGGELGEIYDILDEAAPVARQRLVDALLETASSVERDPNSGRAAEAILRRATDWEGRLPEEMPYRAARDALRGLGDQVTWMDPASGAAPPIQQRAGRDAYRSVRGVLDDLAEESLGTEAADQFRRTRQDWQAADFAREFSERALERLARNRGVSLSDYMAMAGGNGSIRDRVMSLLLNRGLRTREGSLRAALAEALGRVGSSPGVSPTGQAIPSRPAQFGALLESLGATGSARAGAVGVEPPPIQDDFIPDDEETMQ